MFTPTKSIIKWRLPDKEKPPDRIELLVIAENQDVFEGYIQGGNWFDLDRKRFGLKIVGWAYQRDVVTCKGD